MKKVAIMQPYFFPHLGYFSLIKHTDEFILFDPVQFIRHGWIERNRVLKQNEGWLYIKVPLVKHSRSTTIAEIEINNSLSWQQTILAQLEVYKKSPYYEQVRKMIADVLSVEHKDIVSLNKATLQAVLDYLGIKSELHVYSQMHLDVRPPTAADEWALNICKGLGDVAEYWNPPGGKEFFDPSKYEQANIKLRFVSTPAKPYAQFARAFEPGLSIIDVLMFNSVEETNTMIDTYELT